MTKGGARIASASKAVAKGMGIGIFFNVLEEISRLGNWVSVDTVMSNLNFGGSRNETCRSYFKELWRYGLIERIEGKKIIKCTPSNWKKGGRPLYRISPKGRELLSFPDKHRVFALAWLIVKADNKNDFEQLNKAFNAFRKKEVPLSMFEASKVTGVVRDSIKAIMYGWLEPLGFLDRTKNSTFKLRKEYYKYVNSFKSIKEAVPSNLSNEVGNDEIDIATIPRLDPVAPEVEKEIIIPFTIKNKSNRSLKISLICKVSPLFIDRFNAKDITKDIELQPSEEKKVNVKLALEEKAISESIKSAELGFFEVSYNSQKIVGALPILFLTTKSHLHEINVAKLLSEIGYRPIRLTKSDRPDMIIFPSKKEKDLEHFLHNEELKILVETTSADKLSLQKIEDDLKNFKEHTTKVLKINAKRTLIIGNELAGNIGGDVERLLRKYHPFTIITIDNLKYIRKIIDEGIKDAHSKIYSILTYDGIVDRALINKKLGVVS